MLNNVLGSVSRSFLLFLGVFLLFLGEVGSVGCQLGRLYKDKKALKTLLSVCGFFEDCRTHRQIDIHETHNTTKSRQIPRLHPAATAGTTSEVN